MREDKPRRTIRWQQAVGVYLGCMAVLGLILFAVGGSGDEDEAELAATDSLVVPYSQYLYADPEDETDGDIEETAASTEDVSGDYVVVQGAVETEYDVDIVFVYDYEGVTAEDVIAEYMELYGLTESSFACFYYDPETGEEVIVGGDTQFLGASTVKLPFAMYFTDLLNSGQLPFAMYFTDLLNSGQLPADAAFQFTYSSIEEGGGSTTADYAVGAYVPLDYLLQQAIQFSDNTAMNILISVTGWTGYREAIAGYAVTELPDAFFQSNVTTAQFSYEVLRHLYDNSEDYETIIGYMIDATPEEYLQLNFADYDVADKYGAYGGDLHDYGIVYAPSPYLIGVFTSDMADAEERMAELNEWLLGYTLYTAYTTGIAVSE